MFVHAFQFVIKQYIIFLKKASIISYILWHKMKKIKFQGKQTKRNLTENRTVSILLFSSMLLTYILFISDTKQKKIPRRRCLFFVFLVAYFHNVDIVKKWLLSVTLFAILPIFIFATFCSIINISAFLRLFLT